MMWHTVTLALHHLVHVLLMLTHTQVSRVTAPTVVTLVEHHVLGGQLNTVEQFVRDAVC
jgi:hypothetical protein